MLKPLALTLLTALLGGCTSAPVQPDITGIWINQAAIDAAVEKDNVLEGLYAHGLNQEWNIDTSAGQARFTNGFEFIPGSLARTSPDTWAFNNGSYISELKSNGTQLTQLANTDEKALVFNRATDPAPADAPLGSSFKRALYSAYLGGHWKIIAGPGAGNTVQFQADGQVQGLPGKETFGLCFGGDCGNWTQDGDYLSLGQGDKQDDWILRRKDQQLEIFQPINQSQAGEIPSYILGPRHWLLIKQ